MTRIRTCACCVVATAAAASLAPAAHADMLNPQPLPPGHHIGPVNPAVRGRIAFRHSSIALPPDPCRHPLTADVPGSPIIHRLSASFPGQPIIHRLSSRAS
jgi:hypothetical protein